MKITTKIAKDSDKKSWQDFLLSSTNTEETPQTHAFSWAWRKVIQETFSHKPYYLISENSSNKVTGIMPLFYFKSLLFGQSLVSLPYLNEGGILANDKDSFNALLEKSNNISKELNCKYLELRHRGEVKNFDSEKTTLRTHKVAMRLDLLSNNKELDPDILFKSFPAKLRSQVRRPTKSGLTAKVSGVDLSESLSLDAFYTVFSENMRDLGTPVYPKSLFENCTQEFGTLTRIITVWEKEKPVSAGFLLGSKLKNNESKTCMEIPWASSLRAYNKQSANMLLYWTAIKQTMLDGYSIFDFGRSSTDSGTMRFKSQWGAKPQELHWYYSLNKGEAPDVNPNNAKFDALVKTWQKMPLGLSNRLGPVLTKWIP